jgi:peptidoglycan/LPS O-acetylase OafA/YrhL
MKNNCLNTVRLLAAVSVMFWHACVHLAVERPIVISQILDYFYGVPIFFAMSGYLIWNSVGKSPSFLGYAKKRFRRIYPELWVAVAVEILAIIIFFGEQIRWVTLGVFAVTQGTVLQFWTPDFLRGYGCGTPNGSLWTICVLIQFYILAYPMRKLLHGKGTATWAVVIGASLVISRAGAVLEGILPVMVYKLYSQTIIPYFWLFLIGILIAEKQDRMVPWLKKTWYWWALLSVAFMVVPVDNLAGDQGYGILRCTTLIAAVVGFAYQFPKLNVKTDISYGIYIYHMTVINIMIMLGFTGNIWALLCAMAISCVAAYLSTRLVGEKLLKRRHNENAQCEKVVE